MVQLGKRQTRALDVPVSLLVVSAAVTIGFGAIFALLPDYQRELHFPTWGLGAAVTASFLAGFVAQVGPVALRRPRLRTRRCSSAACSSRSRVCSGSRSRTISSELIGARLVLGLGEGAFLPAARRVVIERNPTDVGAALGRLSSFTVGGFLLGPPIGAVLADAFGLRAPFFVLAVLLACAVPTVIAHACAGRRGRLPRGTRCASLLRSRGIRAGLLLGATLYVPIGVYDSLWARFLEDRGATRLFVAFSLTIFAAPIALLSPARRPAGRPLRPAARRRDLRGVHGSVRHRVRLRRDADDPCVHRVRPLDLRLGQPRPRVRHAVAIASPPELVAAGQGLYEATGLVVAALSAAVAAPVYGQWGAAALWCPLALAMACFGILAYRTGS